MADLNVAETGFSRLLMQETKFFQWLKLPDETRLFMWDSVISGIFTFSAASNRLVSTPHLRKDEKLRTVNKHGPVGSDRTGCRRTC